ncbi:Uncharacterized protein BM_BM876 [Brugia malayi]|uniref:Uncharacterized protein n=1 Tax=Brugia malayi TaxID=6279 RepID=A0A4E9FT34_BRUMA|nr:Uncharacterized protein BM_BM876 [Brugia malayi]VIO98931.1 Uncharacterized protein BM_BM876 [Brugia malayi]
MNLTVLSILLITLFHQQYFTQAAPPPFVGSMNRHMNNVLGSSDADGSLPNGDIKLWKREIVPPSLRFG